MLHKEKTLAGLLVYGMAPTCAAVLLQLDTVGVIPLILRRPVVAILALCALQSDSNAHPEASSTSTLKKSLLDFITGRLFLSIATP